MPPSSGSRWIEKPLIQSLSKRISGIHRIAAKLIFDGQHPVVSKWHFSCIVAGMLRFIFHGLIAGVLTLRLGATPVELTLAAGRRFDVTYALSIGQTTNGRDDLSGRILADVRVTEFDGVSGFKMTGGRIAH